MKLIDTDTGFKNTEIKMSTYDIPQPKNEFAMKLHFKIGVIGASGTGKTTCIVNYIKQAKYRECFDTIAIVSPTSYLNEETNIRPEKKFLAINPDVFYYHCNKATLNDILKDQNDRLKEYNKYLHDLGLYKLFRQDPEALTTKEIEYLHEKYKFKKPTSIYERFPTLLIIFDDCVSSMRQKFISDFASASRHSNASIVVLVQHYAQLSADLRQQLNGVIIFKNKNKKLLELLWEQGGTSDMDIDEWLKMFKLLKNKCDFIFIDYEHKDVNRKYCINFNKYIKYNDSDSESE